MTETEIITLDASMSRQLTPLLLQRLARSPFKGRFNVGCSFDNDLITVNYVGSITPDLEIKIADYVNKIYKELIN